MFCYILTLFVFNLQKNYSIYIQYGIERSNCFVEFHQIGTGDYASGSYLGTTTSRSDISKEGYKLATIYMFGWPNFHYD